MSLWSWVKDFFEDKFEDVTSFIWFGDDEEDDDDDDEDEFDELIDDDEILIEPIPIGEEVVVEEEVEKMKEGEDKFELTPAFEYDKLSEVQKELGEDVYWVEDIGAIEETKEAWQMIWNLIWLTDDELADKREMVYNLLSQEKQPSDYWVTKYNELLNVIRKDLNSDFDFNDNTDVQNAMYEWNDKQVRNQKYKDLRRLNITDKDAKKDAVDLLYSFDNEEKYDRLDDLHQSSTIKNFLAGVKDNLRMKTIEINEQFGSQDATDDQRMYLKNWNSFLKGGYNEIIDDINDGKYNPETHSFSDYINKKRNSNVDSAFVNLMDAEYAREAMRGRSWQLYNKIARQIKEWEWIWATISTLGLIYNSTLWGVSRGYQEAMNLAGEKVLRTSLTNELVEDIEFTRMLDNAEWINKIGVNAAYFTFTLFNNLPEIWEFAIQAFLTGGATKALAWWLPLSLWLKGAVKTSPILKVLSTSRDLLVNTKVIQSAWQVMAKTSTFLDDALKLAPRIGSVAKSTAKFVWRHADDVARMIGDWVVANIGIANMTGVDYNPDDAIVDTIFDLSAGYTGRALKVGAKVVHSKIVSKWGINADAVKAFWTQIDKVSEAKYNFKSFTVNNYLNGKPEIKKPLKIEVDSILKRDWIDLNKFHIYEQKKYISQALEEISSKDFANITYTRQLKQINIYEKILKNPGKHNKATVKKFSEMVINNMYEVFESNGIDILLSKDSLINNPNSIKLASDLLFDLRKITLSAQQEIQSWILNTPIVQTVKNVVNFNQWDEAFAATLYRTLKSKDSPEKKEFLKLLIKSEWAEKTYKEILKLKDEADKAVKQAAELKGKVSQDTVEIINKFNEMSNVNKVVDDTFIPKTTDEKKAFRELLYTFFPKKGQEITDAEKTISLLANRVANPYATLKRALYKWKTFTDAVDNGTIKSFLGSDAIDNFTNPTKKFRHWATEEWFKQLKIQEELLEKYFWELKKGEMTTAKLDKFTKDFTKSLKAEADNALKDMEQKVKNIAEILSTDKMFKEALPKTQATDFMQNVSKVIKGADWKNENIVKATNQFLWKGVKQTTVKSAWKKIVETIEIPEPIRRWKRLKKYLVNQWKSFDTHALNSWVDDSATQYSMWAIMRMEALWRKLRRTPAEGELATAWAKMDWNYKGKKITYNIKWVEKKWVVTWTAYWKIRVDTWWWVIKSVDVEDIDFVKATHGQVLDRLEKEWMETLDLLEKRYKDKLPKSLWQKIINVYDPELVKADPDLVAQTADSIPDLQWLVRKWEKNSEIVAVMNGEIINRELWEIVGDVLSSDKSVSDSDMIEQIFNVFKQDKSVDNTINSLWDAEMLNIMKESISSKDPTTVVGKFNELQNKMDFDRVAKNIVDNLQKSEWHTNVVAAVKDNFQKFADDYINDPALKELNNSYFFIEKLRNLLSVAQDIIKNNPVFEKAVEVTQAVTSTMQNYIYDSSLQGVKGFRETMKDIGNIKWAVSATDIAKIPVGSTADELLELWIKTVDSKWVEKLATIDEIYKLKEVIEHMKVITTQLWKDIWVDWKDYFTEYNKLWTLNDVLHNIKLNTGKLNKTTNVQVLVNWQILKGDAAINHLVPDNRVLQNELKNTLWFHALSKDEPGVLTGLKKASYVLRSPFVKLFAWGKSIMQVWQSGIYLLNTLDSYKVINRGLDNSLETAFTSKWLSKLGKDISEALWEKVFIMAPDQIRALHVAELNQALSKKIWKKTFLWKISDFTETPPEAYMNQIFANAFTVMNLDKYASSKYWMSFNDLLKSLDWNAYKKIITKDIKKIIALSKIDVASKLGMDASNPLFRNKFGDWWAVNFMKSWASRMQGRLINDFITPIARTIREWNPKYLAEMLDNPQVAETLIYIIRARKKAEQIERANENNEVYTRMKDTFLINNAMLAAGRIWLNWTIFGRQKEARAQQIGVTGISAAEANTYYAAWTITNFLNNFAAMETSLVRTIFTTGSYLAGAKNKTFKELFQVSVMNYLRWVVPTDKSVIKTKGIKWDTGIYKNIQDISTLNLTSEMESFPEIQRLYTSSTELKRIWFEKMDSTVVEKSLDKMKSDIAYNLWLTGGESSWQNIVAQTRLEDFLKRNKEQIELITVKWDIQQAILNNIVDYKHVWELLNQSNAISKKLSMRNEDLNLMGAGNFTAWENALAARVKDSIEWKQYVQPLIIKAPEIAEMKLDMNTVAKKAANEKAFNIAIKALNKKTGSSIISAKYILKWMIESEKKRVKKEKWEWLTPNETDAITKYVLIASSNSLAREEIDGKRIWEFKDAELISSLATRYIYHRGLAWMSKEDYNLMLNELDWRATHWGPTETVLKGYILAEVLWRENKISQSEFANHLALTSLSVQDKIVDDKTGEKAWKYAKNLYNIIDVIKGSRTLDTEQQETIVEWILMGNKSALWAIFNTPVGKLLESITQKELTHLTEMIYSNKDIDIEEQFKKKWGKGRRWRSSSSGTSKIKAQAAKMSAALWNSKVSPTSPLVNYWMQIRWTPAVSDTDNIPARISLKQQEDDIRRYRPSSYTTRDLETGKRKEWHKLISKWRKTKLKFKKSKS